MIEFIQRLFTRKLKWYSPKDPTPRVKCQCCEYVTLAESGKYLICPICFWEDEGSDWPLDWPSGANHGLTILEGRTNFRSFGACELDMVQHVLPEGQRQSFEYRPDARE